MKEIVCVILVILSGCLFATFAPDEQKLLREYDAKQKELMKELFKSSSLMKFKPNATESEEK